MYADLFVFIRVHSWFAIHFVTMSNWKYGAKKVVTVNLEPNNLSSNRKILKENDYYLS